MFRDFGRSKENSDENFGNDFDDVFDDFGRWRLRIVSSDEGKLSRELRSKCDAIARGADCGEEARC